MSDAASLRRPAAVLFACNFNRVRSPLAEGLLKRLVGDKIYVDSCGLRLPPAEAAGADPFVETVMAEVGCNLSDHRAKTFEDLDDESFDLVISLTPQAQHRAVELARHRAVQVEYWPTFDPTLIDGARDARIAAYRDVRDALCSRIADRFRDF